MGKDTLSFLDYSIVVAYFLGTFAVGFWSTRQAKKSSRSFFVADKALPWWVIGLSMVAASISAEQMLGEVAYARDAGLVVSNWDLGVYPSLMLMIFIFLPLYLRSGLATIPEYLEKRYDTTTRLLFAGYTVFNNACITLVMVLALGATALQHFLGLPARAGLVVLIAFTGLYTVYGGMLAVAWTQTLQCALLLLGGLVLTLMGLRALPGGWTGLMERMSNPHLIRPISDAYVPWPGLILLMLSTNVWYCCTNQFYVQSCLGAKSERHGRLGVLLTAFLAPALTLCFAFPGYIANDLTSLGLIPAAENPNATYPMLVAHLLGPGLRGFLVAAVLGAIMSTVAAVVNATASVFTNDLYQRVFRPRASDAHLIKVGRITGLITLVVAYPLALFASRYQYIFTYSQNAWCILAIPIMLVFTCGALWKRATSTAAKATFIFIAPFVAVPFVFGNVNDSYLRFPFCERQIHLFNFAFGLWIAAVVFMFAASLLTRSPDPTTISPYVWTPAVNRVRDSGAPAPRWYQTVGFWSVVGAIMFIAIYARFW